MIGFRKIETNLADIHCHIIPYADDGAEDMEEAKKLLREEYSQGVRLLVMTPHLRYGMFDTSVDKICKYSAELKKWLSDNDMKDMEIHISREYYCDERLALLLDGYADNLYQVTYEKKIYEPKREILPFGSKHCILLEFSSNRMQGKEFEEYIKKATRAGLTPVIAHAERYPAVKECPDIVAEMRGWGAYIQVNCDPILGKSGKDEQEVVKYLIQNEMADLVSSDAHDMQRRSPRLNKCYGVLKKKFGKNTADKLLLDNAEVLIHGKQ